MNMEGELTNFIIVWIVVVATMCYNHTIGKVIRHGKTRLLAILPAILLLLFLPLRITSVLLGGPTSFFLSWLSTFKLLLFAFGKGPLSSNPPLSLPHFVLLSCLPIKFQQQPSPSNTHRGHKSAIKYVYALKMLVLASLIPLQEKVENLHPKFILFMYSIYMYIGLEFIISVASLFTRKLLRVELEPQFNEPYLSTSLQDFWGRRWNLMVNSIMHPIIYSPMVSSSTHVIGRRWAPLPALLATFAVSALMHELIFYHIKKKNRTFEAWEPSWDAMCFFLLHGACVAIEVALKKSLREKWQLSRLLSWLLTMVFMFYTALWLFMPALVRCGVFDKATKEVNALAEFGKDLCHVLMSACLHMINR